MRRNEKIGVSRGCNLESKKVIDFGSVLSSKIDSTSSFNPKGISTYDIFIRLS